MIPKQEVDYLFDLGEALFDKVMQRTRYIAQVIKAKTDCERVCVIVEGYAVTHEHIYLITINTPDDLDKTKVYKATEEELKHMCDLLTV